MCIGLGQEMTVNDFGVEALKVRFTVTEYGKIGSLTVTVLNTPPTSIIMFYIIFYYIPHFIFTIKFFYICIYHFRET